MPLKVYSSKDALSNVRASAIAKWPVRGTVDDRFNGLARPAFEPGFSFPQGATVFTIGSCFARHIEDALSVHGFDVPTKRFIAGDHSGKESDVWMLDNYSVPAITNELRWALGDLPYEPAQNLLEVRKDLFVDIHLAARMPLCPVEEALLRRQRIFETTAFVRKADVLVMTLGLAEVWKDTQTGLFLNARPHNVTLSRYPDRFELWVLSYEDVLSELEQAFDTLRRHARADLKTILTVSPVPMSATFTGDDVAVANAYSKSVLRAAAQSIALSHDGVDYYPSFESVTLSDREAAWEDDQIHVRPELIEDNVRRMIEAYCGLSLETKELPSAAPLATAQATQDLARAWALFNDGDYDKALACSALLVGTRLEAQGMRIRAQILLKNRNPRGAEEIIRSAIRMRYNDPGLHSILGRALSAQQRSAEAVACFEQALRYSPENEHILKLLDRERGSPASASAELNDGVSSDSDPT